MTPGRKEKSTPNEKPALRSAQAQLPDYSLSEADSPPDSQAPPRDEALESLADLAPTFHESELRLYIEYLRLASRTPTHTIAESVRDIANTCKIGKSSVQRATAALLLRNLICRRAGRGQTDSRIQVNTLGVANFSVPTVNTPTLFESPIEALSVPTVNTLDPFSVPTVNTVPLVSVPTVNTLATENQQLRPTLDIRYDSIKTIDRVLNPLSQPHDAEKIAWWTTHLHELMRKLGGRFADSRPPDHEVVRQILNTGPEESIKGVIRDLVIKRIPVGDKYSWFISVMLQRLHGIPSDLTADRRDELKEIREAARPKPKLLQGGKAQAAKPPQNGSEVVCHSETNAPDPDFAADLLRQAADASKMK